MKDLPNIVEYLTDPLLLGLSISPAQETAVRSLYGLALVNDEQFEIYRLCTARENYIPNDYAEATYLCGARAGKDSRIACPVASYEAAFGNHQKHLTKGEHAVIALVAPGREQTRIAFDYCKSHFMESKLLRSMLEDEPLAGEIKLNNRVRISTFPSTKVSLRGWSIPCAIEDEGGFFRLEGSVDSDAEIQASIRRGMIGFPRTKLLKISTPYMKSGVLYDDFKNHFGTDSADILVWRAPSTLMNPSLTPERLAREKRLDPARFAREYEAEFAEDIDAFLPSAWVEAAISTGKRERQAFPENYYVAAVDTSGGGESERHDRFTFSILHAEWQGDVYRVVQDCLRGWRRADVESVVGEIAELMTRYQVRSEVISDKYAGQWVVQAFDRHGITVTPAEFDASQSYLESLPLFSQGRIDILDHAEQERELKNLERKPRQGGKDLVSHPRGRHDDYANSLCRAAAALIQQGGGGVLDVSVGGGFLTSYRAPESQGDGHGDIDELDAAIEESADGSDEFDFGFGSTRGRGGIDWDF